MSDETDHTVVRCDLSDLPAEQCACRHHRGGTLPGTISGRAFRAEYDGRCESCVRPIHVGDRIVRVEDRGYVHEGCT